MHKFLTSSIILLLALALAQPTYTQSREDLFKEFFGVEPPQETVTFITATVVDGRSDKELTVEYNAYTNSLKFEKFTFLSIVTSHLTSTGQEEVSQALAPFNILDNSILESIGFTLRFDQKNLILAINTPAQYRKKYTLAVSPVTRKKLRAKHISASPISGFLNIAGNSTNQNIQYLGESANFTLEGVLNVQGYAFRNLSTINNSKSELREYQLVKDDINKQTRYTLGTLNDLARGLQIGQNIIGFGGIKQWGLFNQVDETNAFTHTFFSQKPGFLTIFLNNEEAKTAQIPAGSIELKDFPFEDGKNTITLQIDYEDKTSTTNTFTYIYNADFNPNNTEELVYGIGVDDSSEQHLLSTVSYYKTVSPTTIYGTSLQKTQDRSLFTLNTLKNLSLGTLFSEVGLSAGNTESPSLGLALSLFSYPQEYYDSQLTLSYFTTISHFGNNFNAFTSNDGNINWTIAPGLRLALFNTYTLSIQTHYNEFTNKKSSFTLSTYLTAPFKYGYFQFSFRDLQLQSGERNWQLQNRFTFYLARKTNLNVNTTHTNQDNLSTNIAINRQLINAQNIQMNATIEDKDNFTSQASYQNDNVRAQLSVRNKNNRLVDSEELQFYTQRFRAKIDNQGSINDNNTISHQTFAEFETSIAYAGGRWGVGRPINDSFVILYPHKSLKPYTIKFNNDIAINRFGNAVLNDAQSYIEQSIYIKDTNTPIGANLGPTSYLVKLGHLRGYAIEVGEEGNIILTASLVSVSNKPLDYFVGWLIDHSSEENRTRFFTNRKGNLQVIGIKPGTYTLEIPDIFKPITITIPENANEVYDIGTLILERP